MIKSKKSSKLNETALALSKSRRVTKKDNKQSYGVYGENSNEVSFDSIDISDILTKKYGGVSLYGAVMVLLAIGIIWTAVITSEQIQRYHQDYMALQKLKTEHRKLLIENQRLIIEQQTFSATPQIASRAITQLGMFSPTTKDKLILQPTVMPNNAKTADSTENARAMTAETETNHIQDNNTQSETDNTPENMSTQQEGEHE